MSDQAALLLRTLDGLRLAATLQPADEAERAVLLVHGGGATRDETGFFTRLSAGLADAGVTSLRFDMRGHGESEGRQEDLTLSAILNDLRVGLEMLTRETGASRLSLLGTSFSGGICAYFAATQRQALDRLVLLNPLLNYKKRFIDDKPYWHDDRLDQNQAEELAAHGYLPHSPTFKLGRPLLNEVFHVRPLEVLDRITVPTLMVHGTGDTFVPIESSRDAAQRIGGQARLVEVDGAQHGFAVHEDPQYLDPQSQIWQTEVIQTIASWIAEDD